MPLPPLAVMAPGARDAVGGRSALMVPPAPPVLLVVPMALLPLAVSVAAAQRDCPHP
jgi:hypothetical protein